MRERGREREREGESQRRKCGENRRETEVYYNNQYQDLQTVIYDSIILEQQFRFLVKSSIFVAYHTFFI